MNPRQCCISLLIALSLFLMPLGALAAPVSLAPGDIRQIQSGDTLDLDQDGTPDTIEVSLSKDGDGNVSNHTLKINDQSIEGLGVSYSGDIWALRTIGGYETMVMVFDLGPSDDPCLNCYLYEDGKLHYVGDIPSPPEMLSQSTGLITGMVRGNVLQTWYHPADFMISHNYQYDEKTDTSSDTPLVIEVPRAMYPMGTQVTLGRDLTLLVSPVTGADIAITLRKDDKAVLSASDDSRWVYIMTLEIEKYDGMDSMYRAGWFDIGTDTWEGIKVGGEMVPAEELFQGLIYAD